MCVCVRACTCVCPRGSGVLTGSQSKHDNPVSLCQCQACRNASWSSEKFISVFGWKSERRRKRERERERGREGRRGNKKKWKNNRSIENGGVSEGVRKSHQNKVTWTNVTCLCCWQAVYLIHFDFPSFSPSLKCHTHTHFHAATDSSLQFLKSGFFYLTYFSLQIISHADCVFMLMIIIIGL